MTREEAITALAQGGIPERYRRNIGTIGIKGQQILLESRVAVIGAGGLGGTIVELLARMGVGTLRVIDGDTFAPHNLNRQLLSSERNMGELKTDAAQARIQQVNSHVVVEAVPQMLGVENAERLLADVDVVVDALDTISTRLLLNDVVRNMRIPLVHAAIAGFTGQVMSVLPGDIGLECVYKLIEGTERGIETVLGNPAATPAIAASLQVQEVVKILTGIGEPLRNKMIYFDTEENIFEIIHFAK